MESYGKVRVLELYAGIGGMHYALKDSKVEFEVISMDVNPETNAIYNHNFPGNRVKQRNIQSITAQEINKLEVNAILMSPPCQPFTRLGLGKDTADNRCASFLHVCDLLPSLTSPLNYILVENVVGFESSETRVRLLDRLSEGGFKCQEFLLSPYCIGIPNSRMRYYLLATRDEFHFKENHHIWDCLPWCQTPPDLDTISSYLDPTPHPTEHLLSKPLLLKYGKVLDIVQKGSNRSCCFTRAYGRYVEGSGSVLQGNESVNVNEAYSVGGNKLLELELRYFTPSEVARLMGFPEQFSFPSNTGTRLKYKALGNSLNVKVVSELIANLCK